MITVTCILVHGHVGFTPEYVYRLRSMVRRRLTVSHRFVCLTDQPRALERLDGDVVKITPRPGIFAWWSKIELFNRDHGLRGRVLYLDLDVLAVRRLDDVVDYPAPFALVPHAGNWQGKGPRHVIPRYNSSVMVFDACDRLHLLYDRWSPEEASRLWGDQDWIADQMPDEAVMPLSWFPRLGELMRRDRCDVIFPCVPSTEVHWPTEARIVLCKKPKNHDARLRWHWFDREWQ